MKQRARPSKKKHRTKSILGPGAQINRRRFLANTGALGSALILGPGRGWSQAASVPASDRIAVAVIGCGSQGRADMRGMSWNPNIEIMAFCDVDQGRMKQAQDEVRKIANISKAQNRTGSFITSTDFRDILVRPDIDAVLIATPDHWHAPIVTAAARAGKDMYCEKPLSLTVKQGRVMSDTVRRFGRVFQTGSWQRSKGNFRTACELVRNGRVGKVKRITVSLPEGKTAGSLPEVPVPKGFDYDMWLGPAPWAPYNPERCHFNFRHNFDYSGGLLTDWGAHHLDIARWGMGDVLDGPVEIEGQGEFPADGLYNTAVHYRIEYRYANGLVMVARDSETHGVKFEGDRGWISVNRFGREANPRSLLAEKLSPGEIHLEKSADHTVNFVDCVRNRKETITPVENAHKSILLAHLGNISMRLRKKIRWDPVKEVIVNDPTANRMLDRPLRRPWVL